MPGTLLASGAIALHADDLNTGAAVGWRDGEDPDAVALRIRDRVPGVNVQLPSELSRLLRSSTAFFSALLVGIAALGLVIGGLSVANTIAAAVFERIRDFGVKRVLGASDGQLGREVLGEALVVTLSGGAGGVLLALAVRLRLGQEHAAERAGTARGSGCRRDLVRPRARERTGPLGAEPRPRPLRGLRLPVVSAAALAHGARQRPAGGTLRRRGRSRDAAARAGADGRAGCAGAPRPLPAPALGRRAAARGRAPRRAERPPAPPRRRPDRPPRRRQPRHT